MRALTNLAFLAAITGCDGESKLTILLTDAPSPDLKAAVVTIDRVYLQGEAGRTVVRDAAFTTDLLTLSDDVAMLVDGVSVPAGTYEQLRFVIGGAYIDVADSIYSTPSYAQVPGGRSVAGTLRTPSWETSGFKVGMPEGGMMIEGEQRVLVVDFDVGETFGQQTGSGAWMMRPVLRATDFVATGSIAIVANVGNVTLTEPVSIVLSDAAGNREGAHSVIDDDNDGDIETAFTFLDPREGPFMLTMSGLVTNPATPITIDLRSGQAARIDFEVVSIAAPD